VKIFYQLLTVKNETLKSHAVSPILRQRRSR
jgi:hypothetical protein